MVALRLVAYLVLAVIAGKYVGNRPIKVRKSTWDQRDLYNVRGCLHRCCCQVFTVLMPCHVVTHQSKAQRKQYIKMQKKLRKLRAMQ